MLKATIKELETLQGQRILRFYQTSEWEFVIETKDIKILISLDPDLFRIHSIESTLPACTPNNFILIAKKFLEGYQIKEISLVKWERIVSFHINSRTSIGDPLKLVLILELMGKHSNAFIVKEEDSEILECFKHIPKRLSRVREALPHIPYKPVPVKKPSPLEVNIEDLENFDTPEEALKWIQKAYLATSSIIESEILFRVNKNLYINLAARLHLKNEMLSRIPIPDWREIFLEEWQKIWEDVDKNIFSPYIYLTNNPFAYPIYLSSRKYLAKPVDSFNKALFAIYSYYKKYLYTLTQNQIKEKEEKLKIKRLKHKIAKLWEERRSSQKYNEFLKKGKLLLSLPKDYIITSSSTVKIFDGKNDITIDINPHLSVAQNAQEYFKEYKKLKHKFIRTSGEIIQTINQIRQINFTHTLKVKRESLATSAPINQLELDGWKIIWGKNARENELLLKKAHEFDIWFHTRDSSGAYVFIENPTKKEIHQIPSSVIKKAALIAALNSKSKYSSKVPVDYTYRKNVIKKKGLPQGKVLYKKEKTLVINPTETDY